MLYDWYEVEDGSETTYILVPRTPDCVFLQEGVPIHKKLGATISEHEAADKTLKSYALAFEEGVGWDELDRGASVIVADADRYEETTITVFIANHKK